jgi:alkylhydroperoxidase/carboxymuconolactone decarboxylase family protein YurZ
MIIIGELINASRKAIKAAIEAGVTRDQMLETIGMAIYMGGGPSMLYGAQALEAYDQFSNIKET